MQSWGVDYWETFAPVVNWMSVRFILTVAKICNLDTKQINFVLAFPQAKLDAPVFMEIPAGMSLTGVHPSQISLHSQIEQIPLWPQTSVCQLV